VEGIAACRKCCWARIITSSSDGGGEGVGNTANTTVKHMAPIRGKESIDLVFLESLF
jgi:hypothetical protein